MLNKNTLYNLYTKIKNVSNIKIDLFDFCENKSMLSNINANSENNTCYNLISTPRSSSVKIKDDILYAPKKKKKTVMKYILQSRLIDGIKKKLNYL